MDFFEYKNDGLYAEGAPLAKIAEEVGTPTYVYSKATFTRHLEVLDKAFEGRDHLLCYSVKVAGNLSLLHLAAQMGHGADIVSGGELFRALTAGVDRSKIVFSGVGKSEKEMAEALKADILMFNVESEEELDSLGRVAGQMGRRARISLRVNPDVDPGTHPYIATGLKCSKFGIARTEALAVYAKAARNPNLEVVGIDCHIGSQLVDIAPFEDAAGRLAELVRELRAAGHVIKYLDMGGGLGISYNGENPPDPEIYARAIGRVVDGLDLTVILEPGRVVSGNSAVLLVEVLYNKKTSERHFVIVNGAMNDLIRPSLYGAWHGIVPERRTGAPEITVDVVGPVCESSDFLAKDRPLQPVQAGDLLAVKGAGAYSFTMSSNYNARPRAAEVLVDGETWRVIRARETYEDLIRNEPLPGGDAGGTSL